MNDSHRTVYSCSDTFGHMLYLRELEWLPAADYVFCYIRASSQHKAHI